MSADGGRRRLVGVVVGAVVVIVLAVLALGGADRPETTGEQLASPSTQVRGPGTRRWVELRPVDGSARSDFPVPMVAHGDQLCLGFGRIEFSPPRPTVARCVEADDVPELPDDGIVTLATIVAGDDVWHLLQAGGPVTSVGLVAADGTAIDGSRLHLDGDLIALRLDTSIPISRIEWVIGRTNHVCTPAPDAAVSSQFCVTA